MISILIPTFNREKNLKLLVINLLNIYKKSDYEFPLEIIIGNDNPKKNINLNIQPNENVNIKIINNKVNKGETNNLNNLLYHSKHEYISFIFDDDMIDINYFKGFMSAIKIYKSFDVFYFKNRDCTNETIYENTFKESTIDIIKTTGKNFIKQGIYKDYLGFISIYNRLKLIEIGGIKKLSKCSIGVNTEYYLVYQSLAFNDVLYTKNQLIKTCLHNQSFSSTNFDYYPYFVSGIHLFRDLVNITGKFLNPIEEKKFLQDVSQILLKNTLARSLYNLGFYKGFLVFNIQCKRLNIISRNNIKIYYINIIFNSLFSYLYKKIIPHNFRYATRIFLR